MGQDGVMVAVAGRDIDSTGERGAEVARLSPAHLPPAGAEVSEVLMSLVLISQQQQMLSEQQQRLDSRRQQEQLAKTEARRDWKDWKDTERDRRKTLNAREMGLQVRPCQGLAFLLLRSAHCAVVTCRRTRRRRRERWRTAWPL